MGGKTAAGGLSSAPTCLRESRSNESPALSAVCLSDRETFVSPSCHRRIGSRSGFTVRRAPIRTVSLTSAGVTASGWFFSLALTPRMAGPGFHVTPEGSITPTVMRADKQVDIAAIVAPGARADPRERGGERRKMLRSSS